MPNKETKHFHLPALHSCQRPDSLVLLESRQVYSQLVWQRVPKYESNHVQNRQLFTIYNSAVLQLAVGSWTSFELIHFYSSLFLNWNFIKVTAALDRYLSIQKTFWANLLTPAKALLLSYFILLVIFVLNTNVLVTLGSVKASNYSDGSENFTKVVCHPNDGVFSDWIHLWGIVIELTVTCFRPS